MTEIFYTFNIVMSIDKNNKILFLPGWYPNKNDLAIGSFIKNHAEAINRKIAVDVFYVCGDEKIKSIYHFNKAVINEVDTYILYYRKNNSKHLFSQLVKGFLYVVGQFYGYYRYRKINSKPLFFHVHVLTRAAILPFVLQRFDRGIKYFVTEHWSRYLPQDDSYKGGIRKFFTKLIVKKSQGITAVSENLKYHMNRHDLIHDNFKVISNVAKDIFFNVEELSAKKTNHFVHVSNFAANCKNVLGILSAFKVLQDQGCSFSLNMVGDGDDFELAKAKVVESCLNNVYFSGFLHGKDVVDAISEADAMILFSNYENQPVVITESFSLGVPVIATPVGGIPEMIDDTNGILVQPDDINALSNAVADIITKKVTFDKNVIKEKAYKKYNSSTIAAEFICFYEAGNWSRQHRYAQ